MDFAFFSERALSLRSGYHWIHPLYPVGYPWLLSGLQLLTGDVLVAGRIISVALGTLGIWGLSRWLSPWAGLVVLGHLQFLLWGSTEGTDMAAAALALTALWAADSERPVAAGLLAGAACMTRYTGIAVVPVVLWVGGWRAALSFGATLLPHISVALYLDLPVLPDQSLNMNIGQGRGPQLGFWAGLFAGARRASDHLLPAWPSLLGGLGLLVGITRRDRRAWMLAAYAALHFAGLSLAFANPRLALPTLLSLCAGVYWLLPRRWLLLLLPFVLSWSLPSAFGPTPAQFEQLAEMQRVTQGMEGRFAASTPWFTVRSGGWIYSTVQIWEAGEAGLLTEDKLADWMAREGIRYVVLDSRAHRAKGLQGLLAGRGGARFELAGRGRGFVVLALKEAP